MNVYHQTLVLYAYILLLSYADPSPMNTLEDMVRIEGKIYSITTC